MSIFDEFGITEETGKDFDPNKGNLLDEGWHTGVILSFREDDEDYKFLIQKTNSNEEIELIFWFNQRWKGRKNSILLFGKMRASCGVKCTGPKDANGNATFQVVDLNQFPGRPIDFEVVHKKSKQLKDDGTPFINANVRNVAPAGSQTGTGTAQQSTVQEQPRNLGAAAFSAPGNSGSDVPF